MAISHKMTEAKPSADQKKHPIIQAFEDFYSKPIIEVVKQFCTGDPQAEIDLFPRLVHLNSFEKNVLSKWALEHYEYYIDNPKEADKLNPHERNWLGLMCQHGIGVDENMERAKLFYRQANNQYSQFRLAGSIADLISLKDSSFAWDLLGVFLESIYKADEALKYFRKAADAGIGSANRNLAICYLRGDCNVVIDVQMAYEYFMKAVKKGDAQALSELGKMYYLGVYVDQNTQIAKQLVEYAVKRNKNLTNALCNLGYIFREENNPGEAAHHYRDAAAQQNDDAIRELWNLFQQDKSDHRVCYHAAIGLQHVGTTEQKQATREAFQQLLKEHPDVFHDIVKNCDDTLDDFKSLIGLKQEEQEALAISFNKIMESTPLPKEIVEVTLMYQHPIQATIHDIAENEIAAKESLTALKPISSSHMARLFGLQAKNHLAMTQNAEDGQCSFDSVKQKIMPK